MDGVAISIIGRPRPLPGHDTPNPAHNTYTLNYEEPRKSSPEATRLRDVFPSRARGEHEGVTSACRPRVDYYEALFCRVSRSSPAGELLRTRFSPCPAIILVAIAVPEQRGSIRQSSEDRMFLVVAAHCFLRDNCIRGSGGPQALTCVQPGVFHVRSFTQLSTCHAT